MSRRASGQKVEGSPTTTDELTLPACFITLQSELAADNDQLELTLCAPTLKMVERAALLLVLGNYKYFATPAITSAKHVYVTNRM